MLRCGLWAAWGRGWEICWGTGCQLGVTKHVPDHAVGWVTRGTRHF